MVWGQSSQLPSDSIKTNRLYRVNKKTGLRTMCQEILFERIAVRELASVAGSATNISWIKWAQRRKSG